MQKKQDTQKEIYFFNSLNMEEYASFPPDEQTFNFIYTALKRINLRGIGLEAGCGMAFLGKKILDKNPKISIVGVDINRKIVNQVNKKKIPRYKIICGNLEKRELFDPNSFDFIIFPYILHHIPDTKLVMENAHFWLKKKGHIIIFDPNASNLILKTSYNLRLILKKLFPSLVKHCASENEKNIPIEKLKKYFKGKFEILLFKTYLIKPGTKNNLPFIINLLGYVRSIFLKINYRVFPSKYSGSDIILVAVKVL